MHFQIEHGISPKAKNTYKQTNRPQLSERKLSQIRRWCLEPWKTWQTWHGWLTDKLGRTIITDGSSYTDPSCWTWLSSQYMRMIEVSGGYSINAPLSKSIYPHAWEDTGCANIRQVAGVNDGGSVASRIPFTYYTQMLNNVYNKLTQLM